MGMYDHTNRIITTRSENNTQQHQPTTEQGPNIVKPRLDKSMSSITMGGDTFHDAIAEEEGTTQQQQQTKKKQSSNNNNRIPQPIRMPQRELEALVGEVLMRTAEKVTFNVGMKKAKLVEKSIFLPQCKYTMHYLERESDTPLAKSQQPTLIFFHGISQKSHHYIDFVNKLDIPSYIRILIPEQAGHGKDIQRAIDEGEEYTQPTHESMLESTSEFLDEVDCSNVTNIFGISLGGAVAYYLHHKRPDKISRALLVSPAIPYCVNKDLIQGIMDGTNNFCCFENRQDVKLLMRDLSTGRNDEHRSKKDPVPKFFHEAIYRMKKKDAPHGHYMALITSLLHNVGMTNSCTTAVKEKMNDCPFTAVMDIHEDATRLVLWPDKDQIISYEQGRMYFAGAAGGGGESGDDSSKNTTTTTQFETISDCGHVFHGDGTVIFELIRNRTREYLLEFK